MKKNIDLEVSREIIMIKDIVHPKCFLKKINPSVVWTLLFCTLFSFFFSLSFTQRYDFKKINYDLRPKKYRLKLVVIFTYTHDICIKKKV